MVLRAVVFFFFSSRRRHTRLVSDWSSDVCSSDLSGEGLGFPAGGTVSSRAQLHLVGDEGRGPLVDSYLVRDEHAHRVWSSALWHWLLHTLEGVAGDRLAFTAAGKLGVEQCGAAGG